MAKTTQLVEVPIGDLVPYDRNAKNHPAHQIEKLKKSIEAFGFLSPCLIDKDGNIIAGHGRVAAARDLGMETVPCVYVEGLTDEQRRAYIIADNRLTELGGWDLNIVAEELAELADQDFDIDLTGFEIDTKEDWFENHESGKATENDTEEYRDFLEKFEAKHTTDDCFTPPNIYEVVASYVEKEYGEKRENFLRPFYPGGDYEHEEYPPGCVVVDNPPFSILAQIIRFYVAHEVKFFLFAPMLTLFTADDPTVCSICISNPITYENGANVNTGFKTNLEKGLAVKTAPDLNVAIEAANRENTKGKELPKYEYPDEVITSAMVSRWSTHGVEFSIPHSECVKITGLDQQKEKNVGMFGGGYLLSERQAEEVRRAKAEVKERKRAKAIERAKAAADGLGESNGDGAIVWTLSEREREIVAQLDGKGGTE